MRTQKTIDVIVKVIGIVGYVLLTAFMTLFGILAILALVLTFAEGDMFNLVGVAGCGAIAWVIWSVRREML